MELEGYLKEPLSTSCKGMSLSGVQLNSQ